MRSRTRRSFACSIDAAAAVSTRAPTAAPDTLTTESRRVFRVFLLFFFSTDRNCVVAGAPVDLEPASLPAAVVVAASFQPTDFPWALDGLAGASL